MDLITKMTKAGYQPVVGPPLVEDAEIVNKWPCDKCGGKQVYDGWVKAGSYLAFAVCQDCGGRTEF